MILNLQSPNAGVKQVKVGFGWTTFFFGFFVPLFRGDIKWFLIMLLAQMLSFGIASIIFAFFYNKFYIKDLLNKGYTPASEVDRNLVNQHIN